MTKRNVHNLEATVVVVYIMDSGLATSSLSRSKAKTIDIGSVSFYLCAKRFWCYITRIHINFHHKMKVNRVGISAVSQQDFLGFVFFLSTGCFVILITIC